MGLVAKKCWVYWKGYVQNLHQLLANAGFRRSYINKERLFPDAETGEDTSQQIVGAKLTGDFA